MWWIGAFPLVLCVGFLTRNLGPAERNSPPIVHPTKAPQSKTEETGMNYGSTRGSTCNYVRLYLREMLHAPLTKQRMICTVCKHMIALCILCAMHNDYAISLSRCITALLGPCFGLFTLFFAIFACLEPGVAAVAGGRGPLGGGKRWNPMSRQIVWVAGLASSKLGPFFVVDVEELQYQSST